MGLVTSSKATHTCETGGLYETLGENCYIDYQPKHPIKLGIKCLDIFQTFLGAAQNSSLEGGWRTSAFAYAVGTSGEYACGLARSTSEAIRRCNTGDTTGAGVEGETANSPSGTTGEELGGCRIYATPVDGKVTIVW